MFNDNFHCLIGGHRVYGKARTSRFAWRASKQTSINATKIMINKNNNRHALRTVLDYLPTVSISRSKLEEFPYFPVNTVLIEAFSRKKTFIP